ncbi:MAG: hypothetical protein ABSE77_02480 [Acidimicrobiales bacterium]
MAAKIVRRSRAVALLAATLALLPGSGAAAEPSAGFVPGELVSIPGASDVLVLGTVPCGTRSCVQLWRVGSGGDDLTRLGTPPGARGFGAGQVEGTHLVFANVDDGYSLATVGDGAYSSYTTDGGHAWHPLGTSLSSTLVPVVASGDVFYGLLGSCTTLENCRYRLGRSAVTSPNWSSVPIPGAIGLGQHRPGCQRVRGLAHVRATFPAPAGQVTRWPATFRRTAGAAVAGCCRVLLGSRRCGRCMGRMPDRHDGLVVA